ncbi:MAG: hypothetical protein ACKVJX_03755 [Verrucomicrobiia bacterium]|jgi:hypothetical protein
MIFTIFNLQAKTRSIFGVAALCLAFCSGCATDGSRSTLRSSATSHEVTQLHLLSFPTAINLDAIPGQDGVAIKVFAGNSRRPKPFALREGTLEILLFDGLLKSNPGSKPEPLKTWSFSILDLRRHEFKSTIGVGYELTLLWEGARPTRGRATLLARVELSDEKTIYSTPNPITLNAN